MKKRQVEAKRKRRSRIRSNVRPRQISIVFPCVLFVLPLALIYIAHMDHRHHNVSSTIFFLYTYIYLRDQIDIVALRACTGIQTWMGSVLGSNAISVGCYVGSNHLSLDAGKQRTKTAGTNRQSHCSRQA